MKILILMMGLFCLSANAQEIIGYVPVVVNQQQQVMVTTAVPTIVYQPVRIIPIVQPVVQNMVVPVIYPGNWPNVIVNDTFFRSPCCHRWVREYRYNYNY